MARAEQAKAKKKPEGPPRIAPAGKHVNPRFLMSGTPEEIESWEATAAEAGLDRVKWLRALANAAVPRKFWPGRLTDLDGKPKGRKQ